MRPDARAEVFDPAARNVMSRIERPRVLVIAINRGIFAVQFLGHDDFLPRENFDVFCNVIAVRPDGIAPRQMQSARIFNAVHNNVGLGIDGFLDLVALSF